MTVLFLKTKIRLDSYYQRTGKVARTPLPVDGNANFIILICAAMFLVFLVLFKVNKKQ